MRLGVDVGGTFTDLLIQDEVGQRTFQAKTPSTPEDQSSAVPVGMVKLQTPKGTCSVSVQPDGKVEIAKDGTVMVSAEAAKALLNSPGFTQAE